MKKYFLFIILCFSLLFVNVYAQRVSPRLIGQYINYMRNANLTQSDFSGLGLPKIAGTWYYVDADDGNNSYDGKTIATAFADIATAYAACTSGRGDGIVLLSRTISGTSYSFNLTTRLAWAKYGITMIGIASPNVYFGRARVTHSSSCDSLASLMLLSGWNNTFINIHFSNNPENDGDPVSATAQVSAVQLAGNRNTFIGCHFYCAPQSANAYKSDLEIRASGNETRFIDCFFGSSSYDAGNNAACWIYINGAAAQQFFDNCTFLQQVSSGTAFGAVECGGATYLNGVQIYKDCTFACWRANTSCHQLLASWFIGTKPNTGAMCLQNCLVVGFTALDATGGNDRVFTNQGASNAAGGIGVTP